MVPALVIVAIVLAVWLRPREAKAHDWYPMECCHSMDCAVVTGTASVVLTGELLPSLVVTSKYGTVVVPRNHPWRESKDGQMHVCMRPSETGAMRLLCIFAPPSL